MILSLLNRFSKLFHLITFTISSRFATEICNRFLRIWIVVEFSVTIVLQTYYWVCGLKNVLKNQSTSGEVTGKKVNCVTSSVCLGVVQIKDEELARDLRLLPTSLWCRVTASSLTCASTTAQCTAPEEKHMPGGLSLWLARWWGIRCRNTRETLSSST